VAHRLFTVDDICSEHKLGRDLIYDLLNRGELVGFKLGGKTSEWRVDEREWEAFIDRRRALALEAAAAKVAAA
jgi:hypothetical protein